MILENQVYLDEFWKRPIWYTGVFLTVGYFFYLIGLGFYRLYLSPIAKFPGRKLAALTYCYEGYYDVVKGGQYQFEIFKMHEKYGPVIRVNPGELHVWDHDFYDVLYAGSNKRRDKWSWGYKSFGVNQSTFGTIDHDHHRIRRNMLNQSFSKRSVMKLEPLIRESIDNLCFRFREWQQSQKPLRLRDAFVALTVDVITEYSFNFTLDNIHHPTFNSEETSNTDLASKIGVVGRQLPWMVPLVNMLPYRVAVTLFPVMKNVLNLQRRIRVLATDIISSDPEEWQQKDTTVLHRMLQSDVPAQEKTLRRLTEDGHSLTIAGQVTTSDTLERGVFEVLAHPEKEAKLRAELEAAMPDPNNLLTWSELEKLPYLSAVIMESLRKSSPGPSRFTRIAPDEDLKVQGYTIPAGTPVGMSIWLMHYRNPHFPDPDKFEPERWLVPEAERREMERNFVVFCRGTRMCLGLQLAWAELYITMAAIFRRFNMELYETTSKEIEYAQDYSICYPYEGSERLRVIFKK